MSEKTKSIESLRKRRRIIPTREAGAPKDLLYSNPADDLFAEAFGKSFSEDEVLVIQTSETQIADEIQLDTENPNLEHTSLEISDTRENKTRTHENSNLGHTSLEISDTRIAHTRTHEKKISDTRENKTRTSENSNLGHTSLEISDTKTPEIESRTHEKKAISDTKTPEKKISDTRENEKTERKRYDKNYEQKRKQDITRDRMNLRPYIELGKKIRVFCAQQGLELTEFFELAAINYIENLGHTSLEISDRNAPYNNKQLKTMWKTKPLIINLYYAYNKFFTSKVKWGAKDDTHGQSYNDIDVRIIELGMIQTQANLVSEGNSNTSINGFLYYTNEIKKFMMYEDNPDMLDAILKINRENWQRIMNKTIDLDFLNE